MVLLTTSLLTINSARANPPTDVAFLDRLRGRRLFELAETFCRDRLASQSLPDGEQVTLTIELSRTLSQHAADSLPPRREKLWSEASGTLSQFVAEQPDNGRLLLVELQIPLTTLARGELARQEAEFLPHNSQPLDEARRLLIRAASQLTRVQRWVATALRERNRNTNNTAVAPLSARELLAMQRSVSYQLARAQRNVARCFDKDSADRVDALTQAIGHLTRVIGAKEPDALSWKARLDQAACHRLLGHFQQAREALATITAGSPAGLQAAVVTEQVRLALAQDEPDRAISLLAGSNGRPAAGSAYQRAELQYVRLETYLAAWQRAVASSDAGSTKFWQTKATKAAGSMGQTFGPYWSRRAKILLATRIQSSLGGKNLTLLVSAAENYLNTGKLAEAVAAYDKARQAAQYQGDAVANVRLAMAAAAIEQKQGHLTSALGRYRQLALAQPEQSLASRAHLQAVWNAAQLHGAASAEYRELIDEHLATWPKSATAGEARWWLGRLQQSRRQWAQAVESYRAIRPTDRRHAAVVRSAAECYRRHLASLKSNNKPTEPIALNAAEWLEQQVAVVGTPWPKQLDPLQREAVLDAAMLQMRYAADRHAHAETMLRKALDRSAPTTASWRARTHAALILSLAGQGKHKPARAEVPKLVDCKPAQILTLLKALSELPQPDDKPIRKASAELQLEVAELIAPHLDRQLTVPQRATFRRIQSFALAAAGRRVEALDALQELAKKNPRSGPAQQRYAELLLAGEDRPSLQKALTQWRLVERGSRPGTARWYDAKFGIARAHEKLGDTRQAARVVTLLRALHPKLGGEAMKAQFEALLARCR